MSTPEIEVVSVPEPWSLDSLDVDDSEQTAQPEPAESAEPAEPAEPVESKAERPRDPVTGQFLPQPPASMPDPVKAAEEPRVLPLAAHLEERRRWQAEIAEANRKQGELEARLKALEKPAEPAPEPEADFVEDPKAYIDTKFDKAMKALNQVGQQTQQVTVEQQIAQVLNHVAAIEQEFVTKAPDYYEALAHARIGRAEQLALLYPQAPPQAIEAHMKQEEIQLAISFLQAGRNPSEAVYEMAQKTYGYRPKQQQAAAQAPARPQVSQAPVGDPGQTLGSAGGGPTPEDESELSGDDTGDMINLALAERFGRRR